MFSSNGFIVRGVVAAVCLSLLVAFNTASAGVAIDSDGANNDASGSSAVAIGAENKATQDNSLAFGTLNDSTGNKSIAIGFQNDALREGSLAIGAGNVSNGNHSVFLDNLTK